MQNESAYWLAWSKIPRVGPILLKRMWQQFNSLETAWKATPEALGKIEGFGPKLINTIQQQRSQINPPELLKQHLQKNPQFWTPSDDNYPRLLLEIPSPPPLLYYQGQVNLLENKGNTPMVGIVGTRYPSHHRQMHRDLQKRGLIISEYPSGTPGDRRHFPARNRIIAGLSRAVLVMEAPEKSGALITARYANEFCRDVYTLPNSPDIAQARGCLRLIHHGAEMILTEHELLDMLGAIPELDQGKQLSLFDVEKVEKKEALPQLDPDLLKIFQAIATEATAFDVIVEKAGLPTPQVSGGLLQQELEGLITQLPGMRYQRV